MKMARSVAVAALFFSLAACGALGAGIEVQSVTKPSQDVTLTFSRPMAGSGSGMVAKLHVKQGDMVEAGQLVAEQDSTEEAAAYAVAKAQADDNTRTEAQKKVEAQKAKVYENKMKTPAVGTSEKEEALVDWEVAKANVRLSEFEHLQDARKAEQAKAALEKTKLRSPIAGVVEEIMVKAGESVDGQSSKIMRIVNLDPLWIEAPVTFSAAREMKNGDAATVTLSNGVKQAGKVVHIAAMADTGSDTLLVRVEIPNPKKLQAGERATVSFGAPKVAKQ
jgi:RND family efflux transporter MFP subunit